MRYQFTATQVNFVVESFDDAFPSVLAGGFATNGNDEGQLDKYLMLQRCIENDPDNDGYHVEWCDQSNANYECIKSFVLKRNSAQVIFTDEAEIVVDPNEETHILLTELLVEFDLNDEEFTKLGNNLRDIIFRECDVFTLS